MDIGSTCTKAGHAGEDCPKFVFPSVRTCSPQPAPRRSIQHGSPSFEICALAHTCADMLRRLSA